MSFVGSTPIARYVYETGTSAGKRVQALGGAKNHMVVLPDADTDLAADAAVSAGVPLRQAESAAWPCRYWSRWARRRRRRWSPRSARPGRTGCRSVRSSDERSEMGPLVTGCAPRDKVASLPGHRGAGRGHAGGGRPDAPGDRRRRRRLLARPERARWHPPEMSCYRRRDLRAGAVGRACRYLRRRGSLVGDSPYGNGAGDLHHDDGSGPPVRVRRSRSAWSASTCRSRCRWPTTPSAGGSRPCSATRPTSMNRRSIHFYTRGKAVTSRWLDIGHGDQPRLPREPVTLATRRAGKAPGRARADGDQAAALNTR